MTDNQLSHLWPRLISYPFRALIVVLSHLWPKVISFPFRALSSRPKVISLIYNPKSFLLHLKPWAHNLDSFISFVTRSHFFSIQSPKLKTQSRFSHLWPRVISFPFTALSSRPIVIFSYLWPRVISFPFRTLSSWPKVIFLIYDLESFCFRFRALRSRAIVIFFLIYDPKSFLFHLKPLAHNPKSFILFKVWSYLFSI